MGMPLVLQVISQSTTKVITIQPEGNINIWTKVVKTLKAKNVNLMVELEVKSEGYQT